MKKLITKPWFYIVCIILFFIPSITQKSISPEQSSLVVEQVLKNPMIYKIKTFFPIAKLILFVIAIGAVILKNKFKRAFVILFVILSTGVMIFQNISLNTEFGYAVLTGNILLQLIVIISWLYEFKADEFNFENINFNVRNKLLFIPALIAFWMPARDGLMYFSIKDLFMNEAMLTYCMITPVILYVLLLFYPNVNKVTLRITAFVGLLFGVMNMITWFILNNQYWWMGMVHLPLVILSVTSLILSKKTVFWLKKHKKK